MLLKGRISMARKALWYNSMQEKPAMPAPSLPVALAKKPVDDAPSEATQLMLRAPKKPKLRYREDSGVPPGYLITDVEAMLHPDDFRQFNKDVKCCGELDGIPVVYALDYIRWVIREEER